LFSVLLAIPSLGGGGAERQVSYLAPGLTRRGLRLHVAYIHEGAHAARLGGSGVSMTRLAARSNYDPALLWGFLHLVKRIDPDIVHTWLPQMDIIAGAVALATGRAFVLSERSSAGAYGSGWKDRLRLALGRRADAIVANSRAGCGYWAQNRSSNVCAVIRNAVPRDEVAEAAPVSNDSLGLWPDAEIMVFAGRYSYEKNLPNLLHAMNLALRARPRAAALLFGDGPLRANMQALARDLPAADRIQVRGFNPHLWGILKRAHVFVSASTFEGQPNTVLEAVAAGCPVVLSDIPAHREFLDDAGAFYADPGEPEALAAALTKALEDRALAMRKSEQAMRVLEHCSLNHVTEEYLQLYENVLSKRDTRRRERRPA